MAVLPQATTSAGKIACATGSQIWFLWHSHSWLCCRKPRQAQARLPVPLALRFGFCGTAIPGCAAASHDKHRQDCLCHWLSDLVFVAQPFLAVLPQATTSTGKIACATGSQIWFLWHSHSWLCCRKTSLSQDKDSPFANRSSKIVLLVHLQQANPTQASTGKNACATGSQIWFLWHSHSLLCCRKPRQAQARLPVPLALRFGVCGTAIPGCAAASHDKHRQDCLCHWLSDLVFVAQPFLAVLPQATTSTGKIACATGSQIWFLWHSHSWLCCRKTSLSQDKDSPFANRSPRILAAGSSMLAPASRFWKTMATGIRVPLKTHAPLTLPGCFPPQGIATNRAPPRKDSPFDYSIPFRGSVWISVSSEQREMGHEGWRGGGGQDQGTSSLVKNRTAEGS